MAYGDFTKNDFLRQLFERGQFFKDKMDYLDYALSSACGKININLSEIKTLISNGADIHANEDECFISACWKGRFEIIEYLISIGADINAQDGQALVNAASNGRLELIKLLVENGADIHAQDDQAFVNACFAGYLDSAEYLLSVGCDIHAQDDFALRWASEIGELDIVQYLVTNGANIHTQDYYYITWTSNNKHYEVVKYLVSQGVPEWAIPQKAKNYFAFCEKMEKKTRIRAQKKIYYWIIPKLYAPNSESAQRLGLKGWQECMC